MYGYGKHLSPGFDEGDQPFGFHRTGACENLLVQPVLGAADDWRPNRASQSMPGLGYFSASFLVICQAHVFSASSTSVVVAGL